MTARPVRRLARPLALLTVAAAATALAGCAPEDQNAATLDGAAGEAQQVVNDLGARADRGDAPGICRDVLTEELAAQLARASGGDCAAGLSKAITGSDVLRLRTTDVKVEGDRATAVVPASGDLPDRGVTLQRVDGAWRISAVTVPAPRPAS